MKRQLEAKEMEIWRDRVGSTNAAARLISDKLECSISKAQKLAGCRYPSVPSPTEQKALAALLKRPRDVLFPLCRKTKEIKAS